MTAREMEKRLLELSAEWKRTVGNDRKAQIRDEYRALHAKWQGAKP